MNLELGQVYRMIEATKPRFVVVLDVRDEQHERGLGEGYGVSGHAWPITNDPWPRTLYFEDLHPWDGWILCDALPNHGDRLWELFEYVSYDIDTAEGKAVRR